MSNNLVVKIENVNGQLVVSSRVVAEQLGKEHSKVIRSLEQLLAEPNVASLIIPSEYKDLQGKPRKEYLLTQDGFTLYMFNIQGYNEYKLAYISEFNRMREALNNQFKIPTTMKEALQIALEQAEKIEFLENRVEEQNQIIGEFKPIKDYVDTILSSEDTMTITQIAADYGLSGIALNKILHDEKLIRNVGGQWLLYIEHMNKGYTKSDTIIIKRKDGTDKSILTTKWTQKGRLKIHEILTNLGIKANIDKEKIA